MLKVCCEGKGEVLEGSCESGTKEEVVVVSLGLIGCSFDVVFRISSILSISSVSSVFWESL